MTLRWTRQLPLLVVGGIFLLNTIVASAGGPTEQLRQSIENLISVLKTSDAQQRQKLREIIYPRFDFSEMAKRALGAHWKGLSQEEQKEFVKLFTDLLEGAYLDTIVSYKGEKVRYLNERQDKNFAQIETKVIDNQGKEYAIDYRLHNVDGAWKVYDVVIENISLVNNYRSQFNRIIGKSSYRELVTAMKEKKIGAPKG